MKSSGAIDDPVFSWKKNGRERFRRHFSANGLDGKCSIRRKIREAHAVSIFIGIVLVRVNVPAISFHIEDNFEKLMGFLWKTSDVAFDGLISLDAVDVDLNFPAGVVVFLKNSIRLEVNFGKA